MENTTINEFEKTDFDSFVEMGLKLWKDYDRSELENELAHSRSAENQKILIAKDAYKLPIGFAIFSIRTDYVEGAKKTPTGYLEGIFVESSFRKTGIAKRFIELGEEWLKSNNCVQIGSDTWLTDKESRKFHKKMGFWEEDELVHFLKDLD